ncbi:hypothetical protein C0992_001227, partial [Termitomyces sp. T32_za158]
MIRRNRTLKAAAARAREARLRKKATEINVINSLDSHVNQEIDCLRDIECTRWTGGVNHEESDSETDDEEWRDTDLEANGEDGEDGEDNESLEQLEGQDLVKGLQKKWEIL